MTRYPIEKFPLNRSVIWFVSVVSEEAAGEGVRGETDLGVVLLVECPHVTLRNGIVGESSEEGSDILSFDLCPPNLSTV